MGLIHTPRVLHAVAKGSYRRWRRGSPTSGTEGIGVLNPYVYTARVNLLDFDLQGHLNNASYLAHAEYSRWEFAAYSGILQGMFRNQVIFALGSTAIRFRKEIAPLFTKFQVDTSFIAINNRYIWQTHNFRLLGEGPDHKIRAQVYARAALVQRGKGVMEPRNFLIDMCHMERELVDSIYIDNVGPLEREEIDALTQLEEEQRSIAAQDDERYSSGVSRREVK